MRSLRTSITRNEKTARISFHLEDKSEKNGHIDPMLKLMLNWDLNLDFILCSGRYPYQYQEEQLQSLFASTPVLDPAPRWYKEYTDFAVDLPQNSKDAVNLLAAIDDYCESYKIKRFVFVDGAPADDKAVERTLGEGPVSRQIAEEFLKVSTEKLANAEDQLKLEILRKDLQALLDYSRREQLDFGKCLHDDMYLTARALYGIDYDKVLNSAISNDEKLKNLCEVKRVLESQNKGDSLKSFLDALQKTAVIRFIHPCFGQKDPDGEVYNHRFTEFEFLYSAPFVMREDGLLGLTFADSEYYSSYYAPKKQDRFELEMKHVAPMLGLEFESADWKKGCVFTKASTEKLLNAGVMLVSQFRELQVQNKAGLFGSVDYKPEVQASSLSQARLG